jgi:hypothetical protein
VRLTREEGVKFPLLFVYIVIMKNIYNKGRYRGYEWAKHLRPWGKRDGNKRFRRSANKEIKACLKEAA